MAQTTRQDRRVQAAAAVDKAMAGELVELRSYSLRWNKKQFLIGVPPEGPQNLPVEKGDDLQPFIDFENGFLVYDLAHGGDHGDER
jgi:hypothetical protein